MISRVIWRGEGRGREREPGLESWSRTFIMSIGWMAVVAVMPARPPFMKGRRGRRVGLWNREEAVEVGAWLVVEGVAEGFDMVGAGQGGRRRVLGRLDGGRRLVGEVRW